MAKKDKRNPKTTPAPIEEKLIDAGLIQPHAPVEVPAVEVPAVPAEATEPAAKTPRPIGKLRQAYNRQKMFPGTATITKVLGKDGQGSNPKKQKSYTRFAAYKAGMTVDDYVKAVVALEQPGCTSLNARADIRWDWVHGFIEVDGQTVGTAEKE